MTSDAENLANVGSRPRRARLSRAFDWLNERTMLILTVLLVALTARLILDTIQLKDATESLAAIVRTQATDAPPQLELEAVVSAGQVEVPGGTIRFDNQGGSYVSLAYAWCWGGDVPSESADLPSLRVKDAIKLHGVMVHSSQTIPFSMCSGKVGDSVNAHYKPSSIYTFVVFRTPSGACKNRQQIFRRTGADYRVDDSLPSNEDSMRKQAVIQVTQLIGPGGDIDSTCAKSENALE